MYIGFFSGHSAAVEVEWLKKNWLELPCPWQYIAMTRNNLSIIWISLMKNSDNIWCHSPTTDTQWRDKSKKSGYFVPNVADKLVLWTQLKNLGFVSFIPFFALVFGHLWHRRLNNLCLHYARQDGQDGKNRKENHATKVTKIPKTKGRKYGMNET